MGGGIDSTTLIPFLRSKRFDVQGIHFDYGQAAAAMERQSVKRLGKHYNLSLSLPDLRPPIKLDQRGYRSRNALLLLAGTQLCAPPCVLAIGIHCGTPFYDCSPMFFRKMKALIGDYSEGTLRVVAPWLHLTKAEVFAIARQGKVPIELTYSCQQGDEKPCGKCLSCKDRRALLGHP
jgi:7-cyano-7-deazaguanine synthase